MTDQSTQTHPPAPRELRDLRVLAHPLRLRLLSLLGGAALSAAEAARELGDTQANVSYHLRRLHDAGLVDVVEEVAIRGGKAKRYRHDPTSGERLGMAGAPELFLAMSAELARRAVLQAPGTRSTFTDAEFSIDDAAYRKVEALVREAGIVLADAAQPSGTAGTHRVAATLALFELAQGDAQ
ncbi:helix-turn-helix domain-containing protein [Leifsonia sp. Le1]|uniref:helix-turn-helix domain-containing protein n=1 Tax=Leifsonia sp. Le1 TaxID=3404918 RepID=UPI003EB87F78